MVGVTEDGLTRKEQLLRTLRGEIFAAEMKVILDKELGRETSETVKRLAAMKRPLVESNQPFSGTTDKRTYAQTRTDELLRTLRREIFAAEIKVLLDKELGRETSSTVKRLAAMKPPPLSNSRPVEAEPTRTRSRTRTLYVSARSGRSVFAKSGSAASGAVSTKEGRVAAGSFVSQRSAHSFK